ncbi:heptosyltransferase-3 [Pseudarcicella hirudinis]|uniref:Heptosyltransferase-3 n=1 Tax=Pseudarcicella hirudinis TaxID=1079859 RepID=A0A1I5Y695_9BACT|nr:glycosyltransferase family 9 protein [Pseudarcicella hirudinis]SFQ39761.1 heptosyltransferase-3 [Pseudarcicella hirudinis]
MKTLKNIKIWSNRIQKIWDAVSTFTIFQIQKSNFKLQKLSNPRQERVGILLAEQFGDIVACEPIGREIRRRHPNAVIYWIVRSPFQEVLISNPAIDKILIEKNVLHSVLIQKSSIFDNLYNLHLSNRTFKLFNRFQPFRLINPVADHLGINIENYFNFGNILEVFSLLGGLEKINEAPKIYIPETVKHKIETLKKPSKYIVVHCHSNYPPKDWQIHHWEHLINNLIEYFDYEVVEIGLKSNLTIHSDHYHNFCGKFSLLETAEIIRHAAAFIGIDSGPAHFANAVDTFGFILLGKLNTFDGYMPYSGKYETQENAQLIIKKGQPCSQLTFEEVWLPISERLKTFQ